MKWISAKWRPDGAISVSIKALRESPDYRGVTYERGIGVHSIFKYMLNLDGNGRRFSAMVGVDDESGRLATVEFFFGRQADPLAEWGDEAR